ncbi:MAG: UDP-glucose/GDP-mannose dehydrogenase family protein [Candidatus Gastranaerophilales bacterium]|nr:UDP-glucose/GDP-mannose dehydrogenase family protein [Candidatus Gastranaerophilales bacterium]
MITVAGLGFVGLTTALGLAEKGNIVYGFDVDNNKLQTIKNKKLPFFEAGMQEILEKHVNNNFKITQTLEDAVQNSKIIILCVGTPSDETGKADLKYIKSALDTILSSIKKDDKKIIVTKSTIPPSTTQKEIIPYIESKGFKTGVDIFVANNPEFLREGHAWDDFINPDRIVIGSNDDYAKEVMYQIYKTFEVPVHFVSLNTGEFIKYLSNTFLATLISYSNEMSIIADKIGEIDIKTAFKIFHEDKRWYGNPANMQTYAYPGCGFGGYCLPKDTQALVRKSLEFDYNPKILESVLKVNSEIKPHWISKIEKDVPKDSTLTILGLSFKPESDDIRQTPVSEIIRLLSEKGYKKIMAYDPISNDLFKKTYNFEIKYANTFEEAVNYSENIIIATGWKEFIQKKELLKNKNIYDLRYIL